MNQMVITASHSRTAPEVHYRLKGERFHQLNQGTYKTHSLDELRGILNQGKFKFKCWANLYVTRLSTPNRQKDTGFRYYPFRKIKTSRVRLMYRDRD